MYVYVCMLTDDLSPFYGIEKGAVLQEARVFHQQQLDTRRCLQVITKLLYLSTQGEVFTKTEATEVFFAITKLFQAKDTNLRRMVYLILKEICPASDEVIIVTSSLMKDMNSSTDLYRSNSIRVLSKIIDHTLLNQIERYIKQAIVDKNNVVSSAALVSGLHLIKAGCGDIVKRWSSEIQEALQSKNQMVQYHALALLHMIRQSDRLAVSKLVTTLSRSGNRSPMTLCLLIKFVSQVVGDTPPPASGETRPFYDFLEGCLRHNYNEMVIFEAARAIAGLKDVTQRELAPAITVLQLFLSSSKSILRFAAIRTLNQISMVQPTAVTNCNIDIEGLIVDQNRSIATLAITTLLKTGNESSVDRLMKQIAGFMNEISDDFKIVVVDAIKALCIKYPAKHRTLMSFLSSSLREEGGYEFKKTIVDAILEIVKEIPDAIEIGLSHLCEFIEDCEFTYLSSKVLHVLGSQGPKTSDPGKYIRYIYNRVILENATVRAAAVSALAKFGMMSDTLRPRVQILLRRTLDDTDDEVRDRATLYLKILAQKDAEAAEDATAEAMPPSAVASLATSKTAFTFNPGNLEAALKAYVGGGDSSKPFDPATVPATPVHVSAAEKERGADGMSGASGVSSSSAPAAGDYMTRLANYQAEIAEIGDFAELGELLNFTDPVELTEEDTEYKITCSKLIFPEHIVFEFCCTNTVRDQYLEQVEVEMDAADAPELEVEFVIPLAAMPYGVEGKTYTCARREDGIAALGKTMNTLKFTVKDCDPDTGEPDDTGYPDEYQIEDLEISIGDYMQPVPTSNFKKSWDELDEATEREDEYGLGPRNGLQDAIETVVAILNMHPCDGTDAVGPNARSHTLLVSGKFLGATVIARIQFGAQANGNVAMKVIARGDTEDVSDVLHQMIAEA